MIFYYYFELHLFLPFQMSYADLRAAVENDNLELLLTMHLSILNIVANQGDNTLLHFAVSRGKSKSVQWLLQNDVDPEPRNGSGETPLMVAAKNSKWTMVAELSRFGFDINTYDSNGFTLVHRLMMNGDFEDLRQLLEIPGINIDKPTAYGKRTDQILMDTQLMSSGRSQRIRLIKEWILDDVQPGLNHIGLESDDSDDPLRKFDTLINDSYGFLNDDKLLRKIILMNKEWATAHFGDTKSTLLMEYVKLFSLDIPKYYKTFQILLETGWFDLANDKNNMHLNLPQYIYYSYCQSGDRSRFLSNLINIGGSAIIRDAIMAIIRNNDKDTLTKIVRNLSNRIVWDEVILPGENPPFCCCTLLQVSLELYRVSNSFRHLIFAILRPSEDANWSKILIEQSTCSGVYKYKKWDSGCSCGPSSMVEKTFTALIKHKEALWETWNSTFYSTVHRMIQLLPDNLNVIPPTYVDFTKYNNYFNTLITRGIVDIGKFIAGMPINLIKNVDSLLWKKLAIKHSLIINKIDPITHESVDNIDENHFIILENGIAWDARSLSQYLKNITHGVNEYDKQLFLIEPCFTGQIISPAFFKLRCYANTPINQRDDIYQIFDILDISHLIDKIKQSHFQMFERASSIFLANGHPFEQELTKMWPKSKDELNKWLGFLKEKGDPSDLEMPVGLDGDVLEIITTIKQIEISEFALWWDKLPSDDKTLWETLWGNYEEHSINSAIESVVMGEYMDGLCVMSLGWSIRLMLKKINDCRPSQEEEEIIVRDDFFDS